MNTVTLPLLTALQVGKAIEVVIKLVAPSATAVGDRPYAFVSAYFGVETDVQSGQAP